MVTADVWSDQIRAFRLSLSVQGLRHHTVRNYVGPVERFAREAGDTTASQVGSAHVRDHTAALQRRNSPKTVHEAQRALRRFFRFLLEEGEVERDPTREMKLVRYRVDPQPTYTEAEVKRLLLVCNTKNRAGLRDRAIVTVLFDTGVRVGELVKTGEFHHFTKGKGRGGR